MKHLRVEINGIELVNGDFAEVSFTDGANGVKVEGKPARNGSGGGGGLLDLLAGASRTRTEAVAQEKRATIPEQPLVVEEAADEVVGEVVEQA